jgi:hypothetical protein
MRRPPARSRRTKRSRRARDIFCRYDFARRSPRLGFQKPRAKFPGPRQRRHSAEPRPASVAGNSRAGLQLPFADGGWLNSAACGASESSARKRGSGVNAALPPSNQRRPGRGSNNQTTMDTPRVKKIKVGGQQFEAVSIDGKAWVWPPDVAETIQRKSEARRREVIRSTQKILADKGPR